MATQITDHVDAALARRLEQHKGKANIAALIEALTLPAQTTENALWQLLTERGVNTAVGWQLDAIGVIVGQARVGLVDDIYRRYLRAKIATNRAHGTVEDLLKIANLILGDVEAQLVMTPEYPAAIVMSVFDYAVSDDIADVLIRFLRQAVSGGVRFHLHTSTVESANTFGFALSTFCDGLQSDDIDTLVVDSTEGFPASGTLIIDAGVPVGGGAGEETVTYTSKTATTFTLSPNTLYEHEDRAAVSLVVDGERRGYGSDGMSDIGGLYSSVRE